MKKNSGKYREVYELPPGSKTVKKYADDKDISTAYIYKQYREGKNNFEIVLFQGINFIIPIKK